MVLKLLLSILFVFVIYIALVDKMFHSNILNLVVKLLIILWILSNTKCMDNFDKLISDKLNIFGYRNRYGHLNYIEQNTGGGSLCNTEGFEADVSSGTDSGASSGTDSGASLGTDSDDSDIPDYEVSFINKCNSKDTSILPYTERPMPLEYSENNYKYNLYNELGSLADNRLAKLQKKIGNRNREAMDRMARMDKYTNIGYFTEELNEHANSRWWDDDVELEREF